MKSDPSDRERSTTDGSTIIPNLDFRLGCQVAAGLLYQDRFFLIPWYLVLIAAGLWENALHNPHITTNLYLRLIERCIQLLFLYFFGRRWVRKLSSNTIPLLSIKQLILTFSIGLAFWFMFAVPLAVSITTLPESTKLLALCALLPATVLSLRYYFYFFPAAAGANSIQEILRLARQFTLHHRFLVLRILLAPLAVMLFLISLTLIPAPDGRIAFLVYLTAFWRGIFWVGTSYLSMGFVLTLLSESEWRSLNFDPYRKARLATLVAQAPGWIVTLSRTRIAVITILVSLLLWFGNGIRVITAPPTPDIQVVSMEASGNKFELELALSDPEFEFRGFMPQQFFLAGENREQISSFPVKIKVDKQSDSQSIAEHRKSANLHLTFETNRAAEDLIKLKDLYLWYLRFRVALLNTQEIDIYPQPIETPG
ncbi:MAG: hypothetical protein KDD42_02770 [Bdellovibrionales bacterium]|nr:hypothetical protein [Bdellovibrionales bacterium]